MSIFDPPDVATDDPDRQTSLTAMIAEARDSSRERKWHLGNFVELDRSGVYFRFGRERTIAGSKFEGEKFVDQAVDTAPYTNILVDLRLELVAIAPKPELARSAQNIARRLRRQLAETPTALELHLSITITPLLDPQELVEMIARAVYVRRFRMTINRPNAWDVNRDFVETTQRAVDYLEAQQARTDISGESLN